MTTKGTYYIVQDLLFWLSYQCLTVYITTCLIPPLMLEAR